MQPSLELTERILVGINLGRPLLLEFAFLILF
jgi:hypothetical protein